MKKPYVLDPITLLLLAFFLPPLYFVLRRKFAATLVTGGLLLLSWYGPLMAVLIALISYLIQSWSDWHNSPATTNPPTPES